MARISVKVAGGINVLAFLDALAWSEGTSNSKHTLDDGYDVVVGGIDSPNRFSTYKAHPAVLVQVNKKGLKSTAAGRYQLLLRYFRAYSVDMDLPDFSPISQDKIAIRQIKEQGALLDVIAGRIDLAVDKCKNIWASLPGAGYGQREHKLEDFVAHYIAAGGKVAK